jgi:hypothetical protein
VSFEVTTITPVAPRDIEFLPMCIRYLRGALTDLNDSNFLRGFVKGWMLRIIVDGPVRHEEMQPVYKALKELIIPSEFPIGYQVWGLDKSYGPGIARNYALAQCKTFGDDLSRFFSGGNGPVPEIATFLDCDDVPFPWWLRTMLTPFANHQVEGKDLVPFVYASILSEQMNPENRRIVRWSMPVVPTGNILEALERVNPFQGSGVATVTSVLQNAGGFEPHLICGEDGNLWRRAANMAVDDMPAMTFYAIDAPVIIYRPRPQGQSRGLHKFSEQAFHLDKNVYGPMGQNLDPQAIERGAKFSQADTVDARIQALCGPVRGDLWKAS